MNGCINNMRMIDSGREQRALVGTGNAVDESGVNEYLRNSVTPVCPSQGKYACHNVGNDPECSIHGLLSSPQEYQYQRME